VDGLQSEALNSLDATYVFVRKTKARLIYYYNKKMRLKPLCRRYFDNGAGYTNTNFVSQTLTHLDRKNVGGEFSFEYQITSTIKEVFQQDTVSLPMTVIPT
jgi:hypothetical protein